ncbi:MAG: hypothetical protein EBR82_59850 [Caulobacteraceae bacterium]|jgi:hypothetical protein|nr:hypothetical protein [Caulobacteraceae bacterium]
MKEQSPPIILTEEQEKLISTAARRWAITPAECLDQIIKAWAKGYDMISKKPAEAYRPADGEPKNKRRNLTA